MITAFRITLTTTATKLVDGPCVVHLVYETGGSFIGGDNTVTPSTGFTIPAMPIAMPLKVGDALWGIRTSGTDVIEILKFS